MNKIIYALLLTIATAWSAQAQLTISFSSDTIPAPGETVDIDVIVESGWDEIVGMQFSINWDRTAFSYSSIQNITEEVQEFSEGNIGTPPSSPGVDDGELTVSWSLQSTQPLSVPNGTRLFTLRLFGDGDLCDGTQLDITSNPLQVEVFDNNFDFIDVETAGGTLLIDDGTCEGMTGGGDAVGLNFADVSSPEGTTICIPVTTENFDDIGSIQGGITWDPSVLRYVELRDGGLTNVTANVENADQGQMGILWLFDQDGVTLPDGTTLFELCFEVVGRTGESTTLAFGDSPLAIEVADIDGVSKEVSSSNATVTVGTGGGEPEIGVGLIFPEIFTDNATSICVPVTTRDFDNISALQGGISFDPTVLRYTGIMPGGISSIGDGSIGDGDADEGRLRLLWTVGLNDDPVTVPDGDVLFELCFDVIGEVGDRTEITMINLEFLPIEVVNEDAEAVDFFVRDGSVTIGVDQNAADVILTASDEIGTTGDTVCVDFSVEGFENIDGMGFAIEWDADIIRYVGQGNFNLNGLSNNIFSFQNPNRLILSYAPTSGQTVPDGTDIFEVCFEIIGDCGEDLSSAITFVAGPTPIEFVSENMAIPSELINGSVSVDTCVGAGVDILSIITPSCTGDQDGAVSVEFKGLQGAVNCVWTDANGDEVSVNCNLVGVPGGFYTLTATDENDTTVMRTVEVRDPGEIVGTIQTTDGACDDPATMTLTVAGGTGPFMYEWSGGLAEEASFDPVAGGTYTVTITDANMCTGTATATVVDNSFDLDPVVTPPTEGQDDGSIDLQPAGSVDASYTWSNGETASSISGLAVGDYTVTVSDNNSDCEAVYSFTLAGEQALAIGDLLDGLNDRYNGFGVSCLGEADGIIDGDFTGGCADGPVTVFINDAEVMLPARNLPAGTHIIRLEDACGASVEQEFEITSPEMITVGNPTDVTCPTDGDNGSFTLTPSGGAGDYMYTAAGVDIDNNGRVTNASDRNFTLIITDANNCQVMVDTGLETLCGMDGRCGANSFVTPNGDGNNDFFNIPCTNTVTPNRLAIYNRVGETVFEATNYNNDWRGTDLDNNDLPEGGYMWVLVTGGPGNREIFRGTVSLLRN